MSDIHSTSNDGGGPTLGAALGALVRHPIDRLLTRWNWKSAVLSAAIRSTLFFAANAGAGVAAARAAFVTELVFRGATSGFYGTVTQALRDVRPARHATAAAVVAVPLVAHALETLVHWSRGTARLTESIALSVAFTILSTAFNLFAMRRGALLVGGEGSSLWGDLRRTPLLLGAFVREILRRIGIGG